MSTEINEMKLTAYALGELFGAERAAVEAHLAADEPSRRFVDEIRATAKVVSDELAREPVIGLLAVHHAAIERRLEQPLGREVRRPPTDYRAARRRWLAMGLSVAASVLIVAGMVGALVPWLYGPLMSRRTIAEAREGVAVIGMIDSSRSTASATAQAEEWSDNDGGFVAGPGVDAQRLRAEISTVRSDMGAALRGGDVGGEGWARSLDGTAHNTEAYDRIVENPFLRATDNPLSTFSIDVDTASYANARRFLRDGQLPPADAVRVEEFLNYFPYDYEGPKGGEPFAAHVEVAACPWNQAHRLVRVGLKGKEIAQEQRSAANLVFLVDVSGSMNEPNKLPLVKQGLRMLVEQLRPEDRVAMVVYAGSSGLVLPPTPGDKKQIIADAVERLEAGGSTNGGEGIELAYKTAAGQLVKGGVNRVVLCTDGDFNVGVTDAGSLTRLIEDKAKTGVFLSVLGFGTGNLKDGTMEKLADKGNGNYAYVDSNLEAYKVLVEQAAGTLVTIAKDVKIQVEFNPLVAGAYRLIGYENRVLAKEDFNDDQKDAGEIGAGHTVTALYEVVPAGKEIPLVRADGLKYQRPVMVPTGSDELLTVKLRYKAPDGDASKLLEFPVKDGGAAYAKASNEFKFAASVAAFAMILRDSAHKGSANFDTVLELAAEGRGGDRSGYRQEFLGLVKRAKELKGA